MEYGGVFSAFSLAAHPFLGPISHSLNLSFEVWMGFLNYLNIYLISPIFIHFFPQQLSAVKLQNLEPLD